MNKEMRIATSQGDVVIDILDSEINIGLRISGGADSSMLLYLMAIFKRDYRPDINLFPMTVVNPFKPYQEIYSQQVINKVTELTGVKIENLFVARPVLEDQTQFGLIQKDITKNWRKTIKLDFHMIGETKNPPEEEDAKFVYAGSGRDPRRDGLVDHDVFVIVNDYIKFKLLRMRPFRNIDKKGVAELYEKFGVTDTIFPITRSCEIHTLDFSKHCDRCWFCFERKWGFGRYV
jgi:hypothetical protein